jgi:prephenate dehydrogenase
MLSILPEDVQLLGTHPMFGPDSAAKTLFGSKVVLCRLRMEESLYQSLKGYLETHGLKIIEASAEEHDRQISSSLLMTHMLGRVLMELDQRELDIDTKGYRRLMKILETVENDSWQLFKDMNEYNPFAQEMRDDFIQAYQTVVKRLDP